MDKAEVLKMAEECGGDLNKMKACMEKRWHIKRQDCLHSLSLNLPKECYFQAKIMKHIREAYPDSFVWKAAASPYSQGGLPDICAIINGKFYGFEVKRPYLGRTSKLQESVIHRIIRAGGYAAVVSWPHDVDIIVTVSS